MKYFFLTIIVLFAAFAGCATKENIMAHEWNGITEGVDYTTNIANEPTMQFFYPKTAEGEISDYTSFQAFLGDYELIFHYVTVPTDAFLIYTKTPAPQEQQKVYGTLESMTGTNSFHFHVSQNDGNVERCNNMGLPNRTITFNLE
jgi:hypothetical protein